MDGNYFCVKSNYHGGRDINLYKAMQIMGISSEFHKRCRIHRKCQKFIRGSAKETWQMDIIRKISKEWRDYCK